MQRRVSFRAFAGSLKHYMVVRGRIHEQRELRCQAWTLTRSLWMYAGLPLQPCCSLQQEHAVETKPTSSPFLPKELANDGEEKCTGSAFY